MKAIDDQIIITETMTHLSNEDEEKLRQGIEAMQILKDAARSGAPTLEAIPLLFYHCYKLRMAVT